MAHALSALATPVHDGVCFHCQHCVEKYLKALLAELGVSVPKTHDLDHRLTSLRPHYPSLRSLRRGLLFLNDYAVETRYPSNWTTKRQAYAALRWVDRVRAAARSILGLVTTTKICPACNRPFAWRKKWAKVWEQVKYCSEACKKKKRQGETS